MLANRRLMRVFWPSDTPRGRTGVLIGWLNSELDFFVVACLLDVEVRTLARHARGVMH